MPASGSSIFTDADGYQASLRDILDLLVLRPRAFHARLTWVEMPVIRLLRAQEASSRLAFLRLPPGQVFVTFPARQGSRLIAGGTELQFGDVMLHACGESLHQRTTGPSVWASISLSTASLMGFGRTIAGRDVTAPASGQVLRPRPADRQRLLRLHAEAGRIAETKLDRLANREIVRALEQDLIWALMTCLTTGKVQADQPRRRRQIGTAARLEAVLSVHPYRLLRTQEICGAIGVSERSLRASCSKLLGMSAVRYQRLRRLKLVRTELMRADPTTMGCTALVRRCGFRNLHSFVADYWDAYGEMPPLPPCENADR